MRKIAILLFAVVASTCAFAQPWSNNLPKDKAKQELTLFDHQTAFNEYWKPFDIENGYYIDVEGNRQKAHGWKQFKRWEHYWESRVNPQTGEFPKTSAAEEFKKYFGNSKPETFTKESWVNLGTTSSTGGYAGIGRINTIEFHPSNDDIFWVGAASGGLWVTEDAGNTWTTHTDNLDVLGVSAIVVPSDFASSNTLYIGTGDRDANNNNSNGVLKSTDGGLTWNPTGLVFSLSDGETVNRMILHPEDNSTIFTATSDGFYITTDAGTSWDKTYLGEFIDVEMCPGFPDTLYACTRNGAFYTTTDGGQNWSLVHNSNSYQRVELAVSADQPNVVYAVAANSGNGLEAIYKSTNYGNSYTNVFDSYNLLGWASNGSGNTGQGWYDLALAADPTDGDVVFVGGVNTWKSVDGGSTWSIVSHWSGSGAPAVHADKHWLGYRGNTSTLFECNDGGVYISTDGDSFTDLTNGMAISQIYRLGVAQTHPHATITGLQDNGSKYYDGTSWDDVLGGDGMDCLIDFTNENTQYGSLYYGDIYRTNNSWGSSYNITQNIPGGASGAWVTPFCLDPNDNNTIFVGMSTLWKSTDKGNTFSAIGSMGSNLKSLAVAPSNSNVIYAATNSMIKKTTDGGTSWQTITSNLPVSGSSIKFISVKSNDANTVWLALSGYNGDGVYQSTDGGNSWVNISAGIPSIPVNCVIQNKLETMETQLYAGTDYGVYVKNGTENWTLYSNGLPNVVVRELEIYYDYSNPPASKLRACTYGRGLWEADLNLSGNYAPYVNTASVSNVSTNSAEFTGEIVNDFGTTITESGIVYSTEPNPTVGGANCTTIQTSPLVTSGEFTVSTSDLTNATIYYFKAYATNSIGTGYGGELSFVTDCEVISTFPVSEDVESSNGLPVCWTEEFVTGDDLSWQIETGNGNPSLPNAHSGNNNFLFRDTDLGEDKTLLKLPVLDITSLQVPALKFWLSLPKVFGVVDELKVMYKANEGDAWTELTALNTELADWTEMYVQLPNASSTYYIAFEGNAKFGGGVCIDDVSVVESVGISAIEDGAIYIYPNPSKDFVNVNIDEKYLGSNLHIFDLSGKMLVNQALESKNNRIDIQKLKAGIYILEITSINAKTIQSKIVVE